MRLTSLFLHSTPMLPYKLYIEYDFNYRKGARRRTDVVPPLVSPIEMYRHITISLVTSMTLLNLLDL